MKDLGLARGLSTQTEKKRMKRCYFFFLAGAFFLAGDFFFAGAFFFAFAEPFFAAAIGILLSCVSQPNYPNKPFVTGASTTLHSTTTARIYRKSGTGVKPLTAPFRIFF